MYDLGTRIKEAREKRGLSQRELAERINRSVPTISNYETNVQVPPTDVLVSIALALHVPITYLVDWENKDVYSAEGLTEAQKRVLDLLFCEFTKSTKVYGKLSDQQIEIIRAVVLLFDSDQ